MDLKSVALSQQTVKDKDKDKVNSEMASIAREEAKSSTTEPEAKSTTEGYKIYKLASNKRKGRINIDGIDDNVLNPTTKKRDSIWSSDLKETIRDKDFLNANRRSLQFERGILRIPKWDTRAIEFADHCKHNIGSKDRKAGSKFEFYEYDPAKQQKAALAREQFEIQTMLKANEVPEADMRKHASFLGIVFVDELGEPKTTEGIRTEYIIAAKRDPKRFSETLSSKEVDVSYLIKRAIIDNKIDLGGANGNISWAKGGLITKMPSGRKPQEYLLELAMSHTKEGQEFLGHLESVANK